MSVEVALSGWAVQPLMAVPPSKNSTAPVGVPVPGAVTVTVGQPGAAPSELETQVTRIVEDAVAVGV